MTADDQGLSSPERPSLRVVTLNLLNDLRYWRERGELVVRGLAELSADVVALQEVSLRARNAEWLASELGGYDVHVSPGTGPRRDREGLALLTRGPVSEPEVLAFVKQGRVAQRVTLAHRGASWQVCNVHLHWSLYDDNTRRDQARQLLEWLPTSIPTIVCGDFNAQPHYGAVRLLGERFSSCQNLSSHGGARPTFPTPLKRGFGVRHAGRRVALHAVGLARTGSPVPWQGVLDYIFVDKSVEVLQCEVVLDKPAPYDARLYPSDHRGLCAELALRG